MNSADIRMIELGSMVLNCFVYLCFQFSVMYTLLFFIIDGCFKNLLLKKTGKFSSWLWMRKGCGGR